MKTPEAIKEHAPKYKDRAWEDYTFQELAGWVHLFSKRAKHRSPDAAEKIRKDITDAKNYLAMMQAKLDHEASEILNSIEPKGESS